MSGNDLFRLFEANANGMDEFARLSGESIQRDMPAPIKIETLEATPIVEKRSWWERMGLGGSRRRRRRVRNTGPVFPNPSDELPS